MTNQPASTSWRGRPRSHHARRIGPGQSGRRQRGGGRCHAPADPTRWAILIGAQNYDDQSLTRLDYPLADVKLLADALVKRYKVPAEQAVVFADESLVRLEQAIPDRLAKLGADAKLLVYVTGHAYKDDHGVVYLRSKNFDFKRPNLTGLELQWLVDQLEKCPAKEKLLLLDCSQAGAGDDLARDIVHGGDAAIAENASRPCTLRTVWAIASCRAGQRGQVWPTKGHGLFAWCLAEGYAGRADTNHDGRVEPTQLIGYLQGAMSAAGGESESCATPQLFRPDDRPPRLTDDANKEIRKLAALLRNVKIDMDAAREQYVATRHAAGKELEPRLLWSLLLTKGKESDAATKRFEALKGEKPDLLLPMQGLAWLRFQKRTYTAGMNDLVELIDKIPNRQSPAVLIPPGCGDLQVGRPVAAVRRHSRTRGLSPGTELLAELDAAVAKHGSEGQRLYQEGRDHSASVLADFDQQLASGTDPARSPSSRWSGIGWSTTPTSPSSSIPMISWPGWTSRDSPSALPRLAARPAATIPAPRVWPAVTISPTSRRPTRSTAAEPPAGREPAWPPAAADHGLFTSAVRDKAADKRHSLREVGVGRLGNQRVERSS